MSLCEKCGAEHAHLYVMSHATITLCRVCYHAIVRRALELASTPRAQETK